MITYLLAALWGAFVLVSMDGWGVMIYMLLRLRFQTGWGQRVGLGLAFSACLGGVFDLLGIISPLLIVGYLALGVVAFIYHIVHAAKRQAVNNGQSVDLTDFIHRLVLGAKRSTSKMRSATLLATLGLTLAVGLLGIRVAGSVVTLQPQRDTQPINFNIYDDFQAYLVYPVKMIETGTIGADPFSVRRSPSHSYGGGAFLQTFVLAALPIQNLRLLDVGLGTIIIIALLWTYMSKLKTTLTAKAFVILIFLASPPPIINTTALLVPAALFLSLFLSFEYVPNDSPQLSRAALFGLHIAALCVLKSSLIPAALAFAGVQSCFALMRASSKRRTAVDSLLWFAFAGLAMLPWMLDAKRWTGTFIPRSLDAYYAHPIRVASLKAVTGWPFLLQHLREVPRTPCVVLAVLAGLLLLKLPKGKNRDAFWSLLAAAAVGSLAITLAVAGSVNNIDRFMYAFLISALLVGFAKISSVVNLYRKGSARNVVRVVVIAAAAVLVLTTESQAASMYKAWLLTGARAARGDTLNFAAQAAKHRNMQSVLPSSATVLAALDYPFLLDFRRNQIFIIDAPGQASLKPGLPFFQGSEPVATYLISHGIRYVAYDYGTQASIPKKGKWVALANDDRYQSAQAVVRLTFDFHDNLEELGRTRERIYDDGTAFILDLLKPVRPIAVDNDHSKLNPPMPQASKFMNLKAISPPIEFYLDGVTSGGLTLDRGHGPAHPEKTTSG